jgi:glutathione reductase (NADPH)
MKFDYDLFVIGGGSGGVRAARIAASHGASVAIAEADRFGGTCVIRGCVPKKLLMYGSKFLSEFEDAAGYGWNGAPPAHDWGAMISAVDREVARLENIYRRLLENAGVKMFDARARIAGPHLVEVNGSTVSAKIILIATGAMPVRPEVPGAELMITSNEALQCREAPKRIVVVGGGYIACEFAGIFNGVGASVIQLHRGDQILRGFDGDLRNHLASEMKKKGIDLRTRIDIERIEQSKAGLIVHLKNGDAIEADAVLAATGRRCNTMNLGLENVGVELDEAGAVRVDAHSRSTVDHIFAVGDVTNRLNLTPVAIAEGHAFADNEFGKGKRVADHRNVPCAVFSQPQASTVGMSEELAREVRHAIDVYKSTFRPMRATLSGRDESVLIKLVVDAETDKVLGAHMVGPDASEIIQGIAIAIKAGATKADFDATIGIHPTLAEEFVTLRK